MGMNSVSPHQQLPIFSHARSWRYIGLSHLWYHSGQVYGRGGHGLHNQRHWHDKVHNGDIWVFFPCQGLVLIPSAAPAVMSHGSEALSSHVGCCRGCCSLEGVYHLTGYDVFQHFAGYAFLADWLVIGWIVYMLALHVDWCDQRFPPVCRNFTGVQITVRSRAVLCNSSFRILVEIQSGPMAVQKLSAFI